MTSAFFFTGNQQLLYISINTDIDCVLTQFLIIFNFLASLKVVLISMFAILMMTAKSATLGLPKIKVL